MVFGREEIFSPHVGERPDGSMDYVVVSGISCRLPKSCNMEEFKKHLMNGDDLVTENNRWQSESHGLPPEAGTIADIDKFDAGFFGVPPKLADSMDPQLRMMLELTHEALIDSGVSPVTLRGSDTAVCVGCASSEMWEALSSQGSQVTGYSPLGCTTSMFANRISFSFDFKGPSYGLRNGCASGMLALDRAVACIRSGDCASAVVIGCNLCLKPSASVQLAEMDLLSSDGRCRCFDINGDGAGRSEGLVVMYLQRKAAAKRVYCTIIHSKSSTFTSENNNLTYPSFEEERKFLQETYNEARIDPSHIAYVEASTSCHGPSDSIEMSAISDVICRNRKKPLLVGSVKSNIGHTEAVSGLASMSKIILAMEEGMIPPTLHYRGPNNGPVQVVTEKTRLNGEYCSVSTFGLGNANVHTIMKSFSDKCNRYHFAYEKKRLCIYSARTKEGLASIFRLIKSHPRDSYLHYLLNETSGPANKQLAYRGFTVVNSKTQVEDIQKVELNSRRPVWFVFSGMGTQWPKMGRQMMEIDNFKASIMKSDRFLRQTGIHLYDMIMEGDPNTFDSVTYSFVAIAAIQVALTDLLLSMGIRPDGIVGHSVGELGCGYADGCQTAEETILAAYWRGHCIEEAKLPPGGMAAIGLTWEEAKQRCPEGVVAACHNAKGTVTVSGPAERVSEFVKELKEKQIFAKEVNSAGVAFHSGFMKQVAPRLREEMSKILKPKPRTSRWISSSIPETDWNTDLAKTASADYLVNNLVSPVLFQEALKHIPTNSLVIEIAPHGLLQAVLKRSLDPSCVMASLMKKDHVCNPDFFYSNLGKLYIHGADFNPLGIFPAVEPPVPRGTAMISPAIMWDHSKTWYIPKTDQFLSGGSGRQPESRFEFDISKNEQDKFLIGHKINGRVLFPAAGYMVMAWKALAKFHGKLFDRMPVVIENIKIHRATVIPPSGDLTFEVNIIPVLGEFEICENDSLVVSGKIYRPPRSSLDSVRNHYPLSPRKVKEKPLEAADVYKELRLRGYDYEGDFRGIQSAINRGEKGELIWQDNWVTFLDNMMQMVLISRPDLGFSLPTDVTSIKIDPEKHKSFVKSGEPQVVPVSVDRYTETVLAGSVEMQGLRVTATQQKQMAQNVLVEKSVFIPYDEPKVKDMKTTELVDYCSVCSAVAGNGILRIMGMEGTDFPNFNAFSQMAKTLKPVKFIDNVDKYLKINKSGLIVYLNSLFTMSVENFVQNSKSIRNAYTERLEDDRLLSNLLQSRSLKPCLDLVIENCDSGLIKVLQFESQTNLTHLIEQDLKNQPEIDADVVKVVDKETQGPSDGSQVLWEPEENPPESLNGFHLVVVNNYLHRQRDLSKCLRNLTKVLHDGGFILLNEITHNPHLHLAVNGLTSELPVVAESRTVACYCDQQRWKEIFQKEGLEVVTEKSDGLLSTMFLLRKVSHNSMEKQIVLQLDEDVSKSVDGLKVALKEVMDKPKGENLWLICNHPQSGVLGMVNCLRKEPGGEKIRCIFNMSKSGDIMTLTADLIQKDLVINVYKDGVWGSMRHLPLDMGSMLRDQSSGYLDILKKGDLSTTAWKEFDPEVKDETKVHCKVHYTSLGIKDMMYALGRLVTDCDYLMGREFSGVTEDGQQVMGVVDKQALATDVWVEKDYLIDIPKGWTLPEAATVSSAFGLAYYALMDKGKITQDTAVLIYNASSSLGQAAVSIAMFMRCKIFTLVTTKENQQYLKLKYPSLDDIYVMENSNQFEGEILRTTKGKGVGVVLTATEDNPHGLLLSILRNGGKYLDLSSDVNNDLIDKDSLHENITYCHIKTNDLGPERMRRMVRYVKQGIEDKVVHPLDFTCYPHSQIQHAIQRLQNTDNLKIPIVQIRDDSKEETKVKTLTRLFSPDKSYILVGGLGGVGLELADWMAREGARKLVLTSRSGIKTGYQERKLRLLKGRYVLVVVSTKDVTTEDGCEALLEECKDLGPVGGIFNLAMVLEDGLFENQTPESFRRVCRPKVTGTKNLDQLTRTHCKDSLDWFVMFSSIASGRGNIGQTNYAYGNSVMERICEERKRCGLPGLAIQWGAIGDVGVVIDKMGGNDTAVGGTLPQRMASLLDTMKRAMMEDQPVVSSFVPAEKVKVIGDTSEEKTLTPVESVMKVIGITDIDSVNPSTNLLDLGLDSLMTTEIKQNLERQFGIALTVADIRKLTVKQLKDYDQSSKGDKQEQKQEKEVVRDQKLGYNLIPKEEIVTLKSVENDQEPVFIVHMLPGPVDQFKPLIEDLDHSVYVIQCTADSPLYSIKSLAGYYLQEIEYIYRDRPIHLIGYSLGARVALEMALQKQRTAGDPGVKSLMLIESPLPYIEKSLKAVAPGMEREKENLRALLKVLNIDSDILNGKNIEDDVDLVTRIISGRFGNQLEPDHIRKYIHIFRRQLTLITEYTPEFQYQGHTTLVSDDEQSILYAKEYFTQDVQHEHISLKNQLFTEDNMPALKDIFHRTMTKK